MTKYVQKTLIAHLFGFLTLILTHIFWSIIVYGNASSGDTGIIIIWSGIFLTIFYLIFVLVPKKTIEKLSVKMNLIGFSFSFALYSLIGFIILIGWIFLNSSFNGVFFDAFFYGLTFGFTFYTLNINKRKINFKGFITIFSIPIFLFLFYIMILPRIFPSFAFKIVPKETKDEIVKKTLPKFKKGDDFKDLEKALPGYFNSINCNFSTNSLMKDFQYTLVVENCKITKIEYGPRKNDNGITEMVVEESIKKK